MQICDNYTSSKMTNYIKYLELLAGIVGVIVYSKKMKSVWFAFAASLIVLHFLEQLGQWFAKKELYSYNTSLYKWVVIPFLFSMYHFVYYKISTGKVKAFVAFALAAFLLVVFAENIFLKQLHFFSISLSLGIGCISVLIFSLLFFNSLMKSDLILSFPKNMSFWFCSALFIFYIGCFPYLAFFNSLAKPEYQNIQITYRWIFGVLNYLMYTLFIVGFICSRPK